MAGEGLSYQELKRQYENLDNQAKKRKFLQDHPNFADRYQRENGIGGSVGGSLPGPGATPPPSTPVPSTPTTPTGPNRPPGAPTSIPANATNVVQLPDGSWIWNNPDGTRTVLTHDGKTYTLNPGESLTDPENFPDYKPPKDEDEDEDEDEEPEFDNDLMARIADLLGQYGLDTPELLSFAREAISKGWSINEFMLELRRHPGYLANPLFAANVERSKSGERFMSEGEILNWASENRRIAKQYGYNVPSDNYLAAGLKSGLSLAEIEQRYQIQDRINLFGAGVKMAAQEMGFEIGDEDLFEIFDPERDTKEWEDMFRRAQMRGRPLTLGLGIRSETEARAWEMMGLSPDEVFKRMESVAGNRSRFERLGTIEENIRKGLPNNFGAHLMTAENGLLIRALVFQQPDALAELQDMTAREIARFKQGGGATKTQSGQQIGLLSDEEMATFG